MICLVDEGTSSRWLLDGVFTLWEIRDQCISTPLVVQASANPPCLVQPPRAPDPCNSQDGRAKQVNDVFRIPLQLL